MANVLSLTTASRSATGCGSAEGNMTAMNELKTLSDRIDLLEARLTFQDVTIETLNETITAQWQKIDVCARSGCLSLPLRAESFAKRLHPRIACAPWRPSVLARGPALTARAGRR